MRILENQLFSYYHPCKLFWGIMDSIVYTEREPQPRTSLVAEDRLIWNKLRSLVSYKYDYNFSRVKGRGRMP